MTTLLSADYQLITFDYAGFGASDVSDYDASRYENLRGYADDVIGLAEELDLRDFVFVGHSVSAMIGVLAVPQLGERLSALVLLCPSPRYIDDPGDETATPEGYRGGFTRADIDELLESLDGNYLGWSAAMAPVVMGRPDRPELDGELTELFCRVDPTVAARFARATFLSDNRADLAGVDVATLILQCRADVIAPSAVGDYVHAAIAGSRLVTLDATGHCPNLSAPEATAKAVDDFVHGLRRATAPVEPRPESRRTGDER